MPDGRTRSGANCLLIPVAGISSAASGAALGRRAQGWCGKEKSTPENLDDRLPGGFLVAAIVKMWRRIASIRPVNFLGGEAEELV